MDKNFELNIKSVADLLDKIRKPNGDKRKSKHLKLFITFNDVVPEVWKKLNFGGSPDPTLLEVFLINLIESLYGDWYTDSNLADARNKARYRDFGLLMFGLLKGYYHTKNGTNVWLEDRHEDYIENSDYLKIDYPREGTYKDIKKRDKMRNIKNKNAQSRPLNKISGIEGKVKIDIAKEIVKIIKNKTYKQYMERNLSKNKNEQQTDLPKPCYTLDNFNPLGEKEFLDDEKKSKETTTQKHNFANKSGFDNQKSETSDSSDDDGEKSHPDVENILDLIPKCLKIGLIAFVIVAVFIIAILLVIMSFNRMFAQKNILEAMKQKEQIPPDKIEIKDNNIYLPLDGDYHLYVEIGTDGLNTDNLECESLDSNIVEVLGRTDKYIKVAKGLENDIKCDSGVVEYHIKATKKLKNKAKNSTDIVVHNSNRNFPKDEATITVIDPTILNESSGKNKTKSPGNLK